MRRPFDPPDELETEAGARNELMIARIRLAIVLLFAPIPLVNAIELHDRENWIGGGVVLVALVLALFVHRVAQRNPRRAWISVLSTVMDVSLITLALATFLLLGEPLTATNSMVLFGIYYIAIMATALRHDPRLSLLAGALAVVQYAVLVVVAASSFELLADGVYSVRYGSFSWGTQVARLILLTAAAALATIIVLRQGDLLHRSSVDWLTRLYNRGAFHDRLELEVARSRRHEHPLSVAMIDIDHFKQVNDELGHSSGDEALVQLADALRSEFRTTDLIARIGGEEFVVMMPETTPANATLKLERFVRDVAARSFPLRRGTPLHMTISAGIAGLPRDAEDPARLLEAADTRLLEAKRAGRNRVIAADTPSASPA